MANPLERRGPQTVVTSLGGRSTSGSAPTAPNIVRSAVSVGAVSDPVVLSRLIRELQAELDRMRQDSASVLSGAVFLQDINLVPGSNYIKHRLKRAPTGILATVSTGAVLRVALPSTLDAATYFGVTTVASQTVSFLIF